MRLSFPMHCRALTAACCLAVLLGATAASRAATCTAEVGARRAAELARLCRDISPATRPPCNPTNSCALIEDEIRRSCRLAEDDAPDWCDAYGGAVDTEDRDE